MFQLRGSSKPALSLKQKVDAFLAFNQDAYDTYVDNVADHGVLLYDPALCRIDDRLRGRKKEELPLEAISEKVTDGKRSKNMVGLGALIYFFDVPISYAEELIRETFGAKGESVVGLNIKAVNAGYDYACEHFKAYHREFERMPDRDQIIITGNEAVALGAIAAGVEYIGGYPITPATPIFEYLCKELPKFGGVALQMEDEIASLASVIGASYAGKRAMTATSGPGLSLMSETINLAAMTELPLVVANVMRGGPSTGMPTKTEQSDLKIAIYGTSGESPRCIMAPLNIEDAFYQTVRAFRIAEKYQMPVILLTDQAMAYSSMNISKPDLSKLDIGQRRMPAADAEKGSFKRFEDTEDGISPIPVPGLHDLPYMGTGLEHNEHGDPNYTPENHLKMTEKRFRKLDVLGSKIDNESLNGAHAQHAEGAEIGVIGWGSTHGAITEAINQIEEEEGIRIAQFHPRIISPLREWKVRRFLGPLKKVIIPEENYTGQFAHFIKAKFGVKPIEVHKPDGIPFTSEELYKAFKEAL